MTQSVAKIARTAAVPVTYIGNVIHSSAVRRTAVMDEELCKSVSTHWETGKDLPENLTNDYMALQGRLIPYRITKVKAELEALQETKISELTLQDFLMMFKFLIRLTVLYMLGVMFSRGSPYPLLTPQSRFNANLQEIRS